MAQAGGIAEIFDALSAQDWYFQSGAGANNVEGVKMINSTWSRTGATTNTISWDGSNPSFQASGSVTPAILIVGTDEGVSGSILDDDVICSIPHTGVPLENGETIVYTSIQISFTTN
jgi:hypothetical protein